MTPIQRIESIAASAQHDAHPAGQVSALARAILDLIAAGQPAQEPAKEQAQEPATGPDQEPKTAEA